MHKSSWSCLSKTYEQQLHYKRGVRKYSFLFSSFPVNPLKVALIVQTYDSTMSTPDEKWSAGAAKYVDRVAVVTGEGGEALIKLVNNIKRFDNESKVFEAGAGTGATTHLLRQRNDDMTIIAGDPAAGMLEHLKSRSLKNVDIIQIEATEDHVARGLQANSFSHVLSNFVLQFVVPRAQIAVNEMFNLLQPGGVIGNTMWTKTLVGEPWYVYVRLSCRIPVFMIS